MLFLFIESIGICSDGDKTTYRTLFLITFGSGLNTYSQKVPSDFNVTTSYSQVFGGGLSSDQFGFVNAVPSGNQFWHSGALDHTLNDANGYMFLVTVNTGNLQLISYKINNLYIGLQYEFTAYLANVFTKARISGFIIDVNFEVRAATTNGPLLAQYKTIGLTTYDSMTWSKQSVSFTATHSSVVLLMISTNGFIRGYGLAIDDIELRGCSTMESSFSSTG
ncbi:unnamed protein product [Rotaria sp. Silwood1]|nr:unnamed protein product [Rotaria sp. Silwood1]CAF1225679.1 unnamed protein product [Rotaria sp. Silwood1]CAF3519242.1 unnamed protein product [Rotaria sp. Silwood1]CAF4646591.1 unnamed protein product [Rotaria sp. Silwood1]CAF4852262.1 unnamed protein product [Rotaria sp. Silwood1]